MCGQNVATRGKSWNPRPLCQEDQSEMQVPGRLGEGEGWKGKFRAEGVKSGRWGVLLLLLSVPQYRPPETAAPRLGHAERAAGGGDARARGGRRRAKHCWLINFKPGVASPSSPEKNVDLAETQIKPN